jgi:hypothetical protein
MTEPWQHWTAPEDLLAELDRLRAENQQLRNQTSDDQQRIKKALQYVDKVRNDLIDDPLHLAHCIDDALTQGLFGVDRGPTTRHIYLSTSCFHDQHNYCQAHTGLSGAKTPAVCKWCPAVCVCPCHQEQPEA